MDARDLSLLKNGTFDFILFTCNGIDYVNHEDRMKMLSEIHRVAKGGGYFSFSTHNLNYGQHIFNFRFSRHPLMLLEELQRILLSRWFNRTIYKQLRRKEGKYLIINDGALGFALQTYFIAPDEQIRQLLNVGFKDVEIYDIQGRRVMGNLGEVMDHWLGYFCKA